MILLISNSLDAAADMIIQRLRDIPVFRFDVDRWRDYSWDIGPAGFQLSQGDISCDSSSVKLLHVRKPMHWERLDIPKEGNPEHWCREEIDAAWRSLHDYFHARGRVSLIHPGLGRWGKVRQMWVAQRYFKVPAWSMRRAARATDFPPAPLVVKANTGELVANSTIMMVKEVDGAKLDTSYPWFLQSKVDADADVTVAFVKGCIFAYELNRSLFTGVDCRRATELEWIPCQLRTEQEAAVRAFMAETGLSFGRLDFLRSGDELWFLELNPNGMWAWLDLDGENGLLDAVVQALRDDYQKAGTSLWASA